ncbi:hypothetical protein [Sinomicrobium weinanense]|uniref:Uncharacterized protein n=1 Tax=Sinomicrobium weinanense TaxID=2842200 RepID=A0A926Q1S2_9FLAO|nr:hypothetical protein [Sinomicrobium weinanense]MBC9795863.1 hypothetical protein [Sinomicrobium weinanense]MBU3125383.1 hypothetical protein [Sinomicrobium weinanense]
MGALELREKWKRSIKTVDIRFLQMVDALYEGYFKNEVVAYHPDGSPMTRQEYKMALDIAESQIDQGDYISADEFEQEES